MNTTGNSRKAETLVDIFLNATESNSDRLMLYQQAGKWKSISSREFYKRVSGVARGLLTAGITRGDRVAILSENRPEWAIADFAALMIGAVTVPIYPTLTAEQCEYVLQHSGAKVAFVSTAEQLNKIISVRPRTDVDHVVVMDRVAKFEKNVLWIDSLYRNGSAERNPEFEAEARKTTPEALATLIYTSGTTGVPKGVMITHGNLASNIGVSFESFNITPGMTSVSFLPLAHIVARHVDLGLLNRGCTLAYCPKIDDLPRILQDIHPDLFVAVPRVYEKIFNRASYQCSQGIRKTIYNWAMQVGGRHLTEILSGKRPKALSWKVADTLVFSKIRKAMGGRAQLFIAGGAPLGRELGEWFAKAGIEIYEGYGLTETSPLVAINSLGHNKIGTVGRPLSNVEVKTAEDGEILVRGPNVVRGYWRMPEETLESFDGDWFKTGDIGHIDADGFLSVTDRKKNLIKTSGGKFITPQPIENTLKRNPLIAEAAVIGERRRFPAVLIAPTFEQLEAWAQQNHVPFNNRVELVAHPRVQALYEGIVDELNQKLARYERLKRVLVLPEDLSIASGTLTPTLKLRRHHLEAKYQDSIELMYAETLKVERAAAS
jgi:long-chain acyl-CoA synthetase